MKKRILLITLIGMNLGIYSQTKIGFNINDAFDVSGNSVAHYGMSKISGTGYNYVGLSGYYGLNFYTRGKERIKILRNGNVGIGTNLPGSNLEVSGESEVWIAAYSTTGGISGFRTQTSTGSRQNTLFRDSTTNLLTLRAGTDDGEINFIVGGNTAERMRIDSEGNVGIGTTSPDSKLSVNGKIHAKEVKVDLVGWSDFVFENNYKLPTLREVEKHIKEKGHLKDIPSAKEVKENGIFLGEMNSKLLQKIEELTLYTIQQEKEIVDLNKLKSKVETLEKENKSLKTMNSKLLELQKRIEKLEKK